MTEQTEIEQARLDRLNARQPAYDAVFAYIRQQPRDFLPATVVDRNAMIWRAVNAALDAQAADVADRADLRHRLIAAVQHGPTWMLPRSLSEEIVTELLSVLPATTNQTAGLLAAADRLEQKAAKLTEGVQDLAIFVAKARLAEAEILNREAAELRRVAGEARQPGTQADVCPHGCDTTHCPCLACDAEQPDGEA